MYRIQYGPVILTVQGKLTENLNHNQHYNETLNHRSKHEILQQLTNVKSIK